MAMPPGTGSSAAATWIPSGRIGAKASSPRPSRNRGCSRSRYWRWACSAWLDVSDGLEGRATTARMEETEISDALNRFPKIGVDSVLHSLRFLSFGYRRLPRRHRGPAAQADLITNGSFETYLKPQDQWTMPPIAESRCDTRQYRHRRVGDNLRDCGLRSFGMASLGW